MNILKILTPKREVGNLGERLAVRHLRRSGYRIIKKNYVACGNEIDIIAERRGVTAFIEVKARNIKSLGKIEIRPSDSVTPEKQRKIIHTAYYYLARNPSKKRVRFDVIEVYLEDGEKRLKLKEIKHLENAFDRDTAYPKRR